MSFSIYLINIISLYIILLLYYESKNLNLFEFHLTIIGVDITDVTNGDIELLRDGYTIVVVSCVTAAYINCVTVLAIILRIASSFINNRDLISRSYMASFTNMSNVSRIIAEIIKVAEDLDRTNIFSIDNESY